MVLPNGVIYIRYTMHILQIPIIYSRAKVWKVAAIQLYNSFLIMTHSKSQHLFWAHGDAKTYCNITSVLCLCRSRGFSGRGWSGLCIWRRGLWSCWCRGSWLGRTTRGRGGRTLGLLLQSLDQSPGLVQLLLKVIHGWLLQTGETKGFL